ncbi:MAG: hypothetical protein EZS28_023400 [Streblomastix strix]|uniref:Uncharacterized protein n=1 Tax=Streblomastix strix TaxID=222440 RepID=A0A5J4VF81_9EUKA|nr:MAG: hypothetical protein EZS28_023400 [Streblomastix strix]
MSKKGKKGKRTHKPNEYEEQLSKMQLTGLDKFVSNNEERFRRQQAGGDYKAKMKSGSKLKTLRYQRYRPELVAEIPDIIMSSGLRYKPGMTAQQLKPLEELVMSRIPNITEKEAEIGINAITNLKDRRQVYTELFPQSLLSDLYETKLRVNEQGRLMEEKYIENAQSYDDNINARLDQPSMNLGYRGPVVTQEEQLNELLNFGSQKQKEQVTNELNKEYPTDNQEDLPDSAIVSDFAGDQSLAQEKLTDEQRQQMQSDILAANNLSTVYDIGALDWGRPPINDIYGRSPFETYKAGYKYDQFGNPQPYMKKPVVPMGKKDTKMKKNYIPTSQLIQTAKAQSDLHKKLTKSTKNHKKK